MNIILIGMPSCGKSTIGVLLAKVLCYEFIDTDLLIQKQQNRPLSAIIQEDGLDKFMEIEEHINISLDVHKSVISTGGSVIYGERAMGHLRSLGEIVYLKLNFNTIKQRLGNFKRRGVVLKEGQTLYSLYEERCPLYEKFATITIDTDGLNMEEIMDKIADKIIEKDKK